MKVIFILRSCSGAGKNTFADVIDKLHDDCQICCTDDYFTNHLGEYNFDATKLDVAHKQCKDKFIDSIRQLTNIIIVANTNTKESDFSFYVDQGKIAGYQIFSIIIENRHGGKNSHNVPEETLIRQENNLKSSLKLR